MAPKNKVNPELDEILARPENARCCDCGGRAPRWASVNLGIFFCLECSGAHRNMGTHISTVKSVTLDKWQPKWIDNVKQIGNRIGNSYYEHACDVPKLGEGAPGTEIQEWITRKYEKKEWVPRGNKPSPGELVAQGRDPDVYDAKHVKPEQAVGNDSRAHGLPPALSSAPAGVLPQPATASNSLITSQSVDLLGALEQSTPVVSSSPPDFLAASTAQVSTSESFAVFDLPDVFAPNASVSALAEAQQQQVVIEQKVDSLKTSLASLYSQSPAPALVEDRFAALTGPSMLAAGIGSMGNMHGMGYMASGMGRLHGMGAMQSTGSAPAGMVPRVGSHVIPSIAQSQTSHQQSLLSAGVGKPATSVSSTFVDPVRSSSLTACADSMTSEVKHADAMKLVLDSFALSGAREPPAGATPAKSFAIGFVPSCSQPEQLDIDPFSIYGMRPHIDKTSEAAEAQQSVSIPKEQPLTIEQMMKMQTMVEQACVKAH